MRLTVVSRSDTCRPLRLTQLFLWESKPFYSAVTRYLNRLSQHKHTLCVCVGVLSFTTELLHSKIDQTGKLSC